MSVLPLTLSQNPLAFRVRLIVRAALGNLPAQLVLATSSYPKQESASLNALLASFATKENVPSVVSIV